MLTQSEFARVIGKTPQYVHKLVKKGRIPLQGGRIDPDIALAALKRSADPARSMATTPRTAALPLLAADTVEPPEVAALDPSAGMSYTEARTLREQYHAKRAELEFKEKIGELIAQEQVRHQVFTLFRELRDKLLHLPTRLAASLVGLASEREALVTLEDALSQELAEFAEKLAEGFGTDAG